MGFGFWGLRFGIWGLKLGSLGVGFRNDVGGFRVDGSEGMHLTATRVDAQPILQPFLISRARSMFIDLSTNEFVMS